MSDALAQAVGLVESGVPVARAAREAGVARSTLRDRLDRMGGPRPSMGDDLAGLADGDADELPLIERDYSGADRHYVYPLGDVHLGSPSHAADRWATWLDYLANAPDVSMLGTGDFLNAALKTSKSETYDEVMTVGSAKRQLRRQLTPLRGRLDALMPGNHEARIYRAVGDDPIEDLADTLDVPYFRAAGVILYRVGNQEYLFYVRHGTGGGGQAGSRVNQLHRASQVADADVYVSGHTHSQTVTTDDVFIRSGDRMVRKRRVYVASGSFVGYEPYAAERGYPPGRVGAPRILLDGRRSDVHVSV